ncbi:MAG: hypothetical protein OQK80_00765, partial [Sedimenticola sp.]|nr:hypothetical protein [Sedimenticola sp.]
MELSVQQKALLDKYDRRDVLGLIRAIDKIKNAPDYMSTYRRLLGQGKLSVNSARMEELASALLSELEETLDANNDRTINASYFEISEQIGKKFG